MASSLSSTNLVLNGVTLTSGSSGTIAVTSQIFPLEPYTLTSDYHFWVYPQGGYPVSTTSSTPGSLSNTSFTLPSISVGQLKTYRVYNNDAYDFPTVKLPASGNYLYNGEIRSEMTSSGSALGNSNFTVAPNLATKPTSGGTTILSYSESIRYVSKNVWYYRVS